MSSAGQIIGGVAGGAIGAAFNMPMLGAQLGMMLGGAIDPPKGPTTEGPRLGDLTVQTSTYGAFLPRDYGTVAHYGNLFWLENNKIKEEVVKKKTGGKGGGKSVHRQYINSATFAVGLCEGPMTGVKRIWIKGELFYDAASTDAGTIMASNAAAIGFRFYPGTDTQMPDPRIQADLGVANTPAWRGRCYIVFYDLMLAKYGEALPGAQVKVELFREGVYGDELISRPAPNNRWISWDWDGNRWYGIANGGNLAHLWSGDVCYTYDGINFTTSSGLDSATGYGWYIDLKYNGSMYFAITGFGEGGFACARSYDLDNWTTATLPGGLKYWQQLIVNGPTFLMLSSNGFSATTTDGVSFTTGTGPTTVRQEGRGCYNGTVFCVTEQNGGTPRAIYTSPTGLSVWTTSYPADPFSNLYGCCAGPGGRLVAVGQRASDGKYSTTYSDDNGATWSGAQIITTRDITIYNLVYTADVGLYVAATFNSFGGAIGVPGPWFTSPDLITWTDHGPLPGGSVCYDRPAWNGVYWSLIRNNVNESFSDIQLFRAGVLLSTSDTTLGAIVQEECLKTNILTTGDIDVSLLTSAVKGYTVGSMGTVRSALEPLQAAWPFDVVQSGYQLKFKPRGSAMLSIIAAADLDARAAGGEPGVQITTSREMDLQLPAKITIKHIDSDREYDIGEQYAERLTTESVNHVVLDLPIVMSSSEAADKARILLYQAYLDRTDISFNIPYSYNTLEPADVVRLMSPEGGIDVRLVALNYTADGRVECHAKPANAAVYSPPSIGASPVVSGQAPAVAGITTIPQLGPSSFLLLDVPRVHSSQDTPSVLATMYGRYSSWPGGVLLRTDDGGTTWIDIQAFASPGGAVGTASSTIGTADSRVWDKTSVLSVSMSNGDLYSATELAVLNGGNHFAYGAPGRWEIIAVQNCTLVTATGYTLTDMLRGRFGTEWAMSTHVVGDKLVALSTADITAIGMSSASISLPRTYRGITDGQDISSGVDTPFTYNGVNLECLSPVYLTGARVPGSTDWGINWIRRSRTDGEWRDLVDVALGETSEAYEVDVFSDNTYGTVKRTISSATPTCTYTSAQQLTDFGAYQQSIYAKVWQLSSVVGRGYPTVGAFVAGGNDPFWGSVVFLAQMRQAIGATTFTEVKGHTLTTTSPVTGSSLSPYEGGSSCYFDGAGDYLSTASTADFNLGGGAMTIEFWIYRGASGTTHARALQFGPNGSSSSCQCNFVNDGNIWFFPAVGSPASGYSTGVGAYQLDKWNHIAFVLVSTTTMACYVNGVQKYYSASVSAFPSTNYSLAVGGDSGIDLSGNIRDLVITNGVAKYTSAFLPPTEPYNADGSDPNWANVKLAMPFATDLLDVKGKSFSTAGTPTIVTNNGPFKSSAYFDGATGFLSTPASADFNFGTGDFTIEAFVYIAGNSLPDASGNRGAAIMLMDNGTLSSLEFVISGNGSTTGTGVFIGLDPGTGWVSVGSTFTISQLVWHRVEVCRVAGVVYFLLDGVLKGSGAFANSLGSASVPAKFGGRSYAPNYRFYLNGNLGPIRITKGAGRHTATYTPYIEEFPEY